MIIVEAFEDGFLYFAGFLTGIEVTIEMSGRIMEDITGNGGLFDPAGYHNKKYD
jgi:hypothetical protein